MGPAPKKLEQLSLSPIKELKGTVALPGSKSLSNRALLLSALSKGTTVVENLLDSDDVQAMLGALKKIGVKIDETARLTENRVIIEGNGGPFDVSGKEGAGELFLGNAGTAMRPLAAVVCACKGRFVLDGVARMRERPIQDLVDGMKQLGADVECTQNPPHGGCPPVMVDAKGLRGGSCKISGKISSQFLSAILMAAPLATSGETVIEIADELVSKPYVNLTVGLMRKFGAVVEEVELSTDPNKPRPRYTVKSGQVYTSPGTYFIEGDASGASYFLAGGAILGGPITVTGCGSESVQGDTKFAHLVERMGATVEWQPNSITVSRKRDGSQPLRGIDADCGEIPDAAMTLAALALFTEDGKPTAIRNVYNWRVKETERMKAIVTELRKLGAEVEEGRDYCVIQPVKAIKPGVAVDTYDDHRMAMVFSLTACGVEVVIKDPGCTAKTFPTYFDELAKLVGPKPQLETKEIPVVGGSKVLIRAGIFEEIPEILEKEGLKPSSFVIVSDDTVFGLYGQRLMDAFAKRGITSSESSKPRLLHVFFKHGEESKTRETKAMVEDFMLAHKCQRDSCIIALGGGVVGDLSGFVAGTYMRGIPVVQVPTSTMAMLDSSVGGKTAINVAAGKNLIGVFLQPKIIFADPNLLKTLSRREVAEGLAEAIKMGCIRDAELFNLMAQNPEKIMGLDPVLMGEVLYKAVSHKADVVRLDPKERGVRSTLNFGHTIGHGLEGVKSPELLHGECIAIGCIGEADLAMRIGKLSKECIQKIKTCFQSFGLPYEMPKDASLDKMMEKIAVDKKNEGGNIRCTIVTDIGKSIDNPQVVPVATMREVMQDMISASKANGSEPPAKKQKTG